MRGQKKGTARRVAQACMILFTVSFVVVGAYYILFGPVQLIDNILPQRETDAEELPYDTADTFAQGVSVAGISLAEMTFEQAENALLAVEKERAQEIQFVFDGRDSSTTFTHADFLVQFNTEKVLEEAILLGNTGSRSERAQAREELAASPRAFEIDYTLDVSPLQSRMAALAEDFYIEPLDATVQMDMEVEGFFRYTEAVDGEELDIEALMQTLQQRADAHEYGVIEMPIRYVEPEVTIAQLQSSLILRGNAFTSFAKSPYNRDDRVYNVKKAAAFVNGFVLKPDEVFSTNDTLGPRTYELGWKPAPAYVSGTTEDQAGGGVCQVSSTLYAAVVKADLEIVYRRNHSSPVSYVDRGLDATINTGTIDFTFKNNTDRDIYIFAYTIDSKDAKVPENKKDKTIHVEIYGAPLPDEYDEIRLSSTKLETLKPSGEMEIVVDTTAAWDYVFEEVERRDGSVWQSYKHYYKNGVEIKKESLAKSTYKAYAGKKIVGPGYYQPVMPVEAPAV